MGTRRSCLAVLCASLFLASCWTGGLQTTESFDASSSDALLLVGLDALKDPGTEHSMTWWPYDEDTNQFDVGGKEPITVVRSKYDSWGWGGSGMTNKKFILLRAKPGRYVLQQIKFFNTAYRIRFKTYTIEVEEGTINYIGDYMFILDKVDTYLGFPTSGGFLFKFDYLGHDMEGAKARISQYKEIEADIRVTQPIKIKLD